MGLSHTIGSWFGRKKPKSAPITGSGSESLPTLGQQLWGTPKPIAKASDFPRFHTNANDSLAANSPDPLTRTRRKLLDAFTPSQPVGDRRRFAGRTDILTSLIRAIEEQRLHIVMYGARGLGKTSLLHILTQAAREARYLVVYVSCGSDSNFDEVFRTVAVNIPMLYHGAVGPTSAEVETGKTLADVLPGGIISPRLASDLLAKLVGTRVVVVLDEFDRCESPAFRRDVAELIKNLSDRLVRVQLVIAGVAANLTELIAHIPSIQRNIFALQIPLMTAGEIRMLIQKGEDACGIRCDEDAIRAIIAAAHGSPYFASLISHHAGIHALSQGRMAVGVPDVIAAVRMAGIEFKRRLSSRVQAQLWKLIREGDLRVLGTLAGIAQQCGGLFRKEDLRSAMTSLDTSLRCEKLLPDLVDAEVLEQSEQDGITIYRFAEDGIGPYLWLFLSQNQLEVAVPEVSPPAHHVASAE